MVWLAVTLVADGLEGGAVLDALSGKADASAVRALIEGTLLIYNGSTAFAMTAMFLAAAGVYCIGIGKGIRASNVYFVRFGSSWALIDTAWPKCGHLIKETAELVFGANKQRVSGPPYISTWNWQAAKKSVATLAKLDPNVLACGHGIPMTGTRTARELRLRAFSDCFAT
ncbi:MAG: hypothetical protein WAV32_07930 [Halobacteriota archaeon]